MITDPLPDTSYMIESLVAGFRSPNTFGVVRDALYRADVAENRLKCSLTHMVEFAVGGSPLAESPLHGWRHWLSVYRNAVVIAHFLKPPPNMLGRTLDLWVALDFTLIAMLFALFHDCRRHDEGEDMAHGAFGAAALMAYCQMNDCLMLEAHVALLACNMHTVIDRPAIYAPLKGLRLGEPEFSGLDVQAQHAIGMCLDADRMDLIRLRRLPDHRMLYFPEQTTLAFNHLYEQNAWSE